MTIEDPNHRAHESDVHFIGLSTSHHNIYLLICYP